MIFLTFWSSCTGTDSLPAPSSTRPCGSRLWPAAGCLGKCKSSILSRVSQGKQREGGGPPGGGPDGGKSGRVKVYGGAARRPSRRARCVQKCAASLLAGFP